MRKEKFRWMYPMNWPDYLFRVVLGHADDVYVANVIVATQRGAHLFSR